MELIMSKEEVNKAIVARWFSGFWDNPWDPKIVDELAAPNMCCCALKIDQEKGVVRVEK